MKCENDKGMIVNSHGETIEYGPACDREATHLGGHLMNIPLCPKHARAWANFETKPKRIEVKS